MIVCALTSKPILFPIKPAHFSDPVPVLVHALAKLVAFPLHKSPQVFVVILFKVGSKVREHYESIVGGANMFDSMCTWYLEHFYK